MARGDGRGGRFWRDDRRDPWDAFLCGLDGPGFVLSTEQLVVEDLGLDIDIVPDWDTTDGGRRARRGRGGDRGRRHALKGGGSGMDSIAAAASATLAGDSQQAGVQSMDTTTDEEDEEDRHVHVPVDVIETSKAHVFVADIAGSTKEDVSVSVAQRVLMLQGKRKKDPALEEPGAFFRRAERGFGRFSRRFRIPKNVDKDSVKAEFKDGLLRVTVPKKQKDAAASDISQVPIQEHSQSEAAPARVDNVEWPAAQEAPA
eukprot:SM000323S12632  [mRNA]  locus=s323:27717:29358:- [translate_table: standard]